jgi:cysteine-rich repeat protein
MRTPIVTAVAGALLFGLILARPARAAISACTAAQISANDTGCPSGTGPCNITKQFVIGNGCTLDFGTRAVTVAASGELDIGSGNVALKAGTLTLAAGGLIKGRGTMGGMIALNTTGTVLLQKVGSARGTIDVSGNSRAGVIQIDAGGTVTLQGKMLAQQLTTSGSGGSIQVRTTGDFISNAASTLSASGGVAGSAGYIWIEAGGRVDLGDRVDLVGGEGGYLTVTAGTDAVVRAVDTYAIGDAGSGGDVEVYAETRVQLLGALSASGNGSGTGAGGGNGGYFYVEARFGDLTVSANVLGEGAAPDGSGGDLDFYSRGTLVVAPAATVSVRGNGVESFGGQLAMYAFLDLSSGGVLDTSGGWDANYVDLTAGRDLTITGRIDATGRAAGGTGSGVSLIAGDEGKGRLQVQNTVDVGGGGCSVDAGCGGGGWTDLSGCDVTLTSAGSLMARGPWAGDNDVLAREQLTIQGRMDATTTTPGQPGASDGRNSLTNTAAKPAVVTGPVVPAATMWSFPACTAWNSPPPCLVPCPTCGNGVVEFPESCDTPGTPQSCDGCSMYCTLENCTDPNICNIETCDLRLGCQWVWNRCDDHNACTYDWCEYYNNVCKHQAFSDPPLCP